MKKIFIVIAVSFSILLSAPFFLKSLGIFEVVAGCSGSACRNLTGQWAACGSYQIATLDGCCAPIIQPIDCCCFDGSIVTGQRSRSYEFNKDTSDTCVNDSNTCGSVCSGRGGADWTWNSCSDDDGGDDDDDDNNNNPSPYCGDGNIDAGEECEEPGDTCTYSGKSGSCTDSCDCCIRCSLSCEYPLSSTSNRFLFDDFDSCSDRSVCPNPQDRTIDCYEIISPAPVPTFLIHPESYKTILGFTSNTHTGAGEWIEDQKDDRVNDFIPVKDLIVSSTADEFYMQATFTDTDQVVEAMYVWFSQSGSTPITPKAIDLNGSSDSQGDKTANRTGFGFMLRKSGTDWIPYIPSIVGAGDGLMDVWSPAVYSTDEKIFSIKGPDGNDMVNIQLDKGKILVENSGKKVTLPFSISMKQRDGKNLIANTPTQGKYNVFLLANDVFGFTPYDNYDCNLYPKVCTAVKNLWVSNERIRYYGNTPDAASFKWIDTGKDWNIDLEDPIVDLKEVTVEGRAQIKYEWNISENLGIYGVVGNYFISTDAQDVDTFTIDSISPSAIQKVTTFKPGVLDNDIIGHLDDTTYAENNFIFKIVSGSNSGFLLIDPGSTRKGMVSLYVTVFDLAGNYGTSSVTFDLSDWMATQGGLLYSAQGTDVNSRELSAEALNLWNSVNIGNFIPSKADVSTELVADKLDLLPTDPLKSGITDSYMVRPYNVVNEISSYYNILKTSFEQKDSLLRTKRIPGKDKKVELVGDPWDKYRGSDLIIYEIDNDLEIGSPTQAFNCNGEGVFFVEGNLYINGQILNGDINKDACIFVVKNDVIVTPGAHVSSDVQIRYDQVNAYIFADGEFIIQEENVTSITDPLYIGGGVHSLKGVTLERYLKLGDRLVFPAFIVNHHSKYGVLAGKVFGTAVNLQKVEVGLKP